MSRQNKQNMHVFQKVTTPPVITTLREPPQYNYNYINKTHSVDIISIDRGTKIKKVFNYNLMNNQLSTIKKCTVEQYNPFKGHMIKDKANHHQYIWNGDYRGPIFSCHIINHDLFQQRLLFRFKQQEILHTNYDSKIKPWPKWNIELPHNFDCPRLLFAWDQIIVWFDFFQYDNINNDKTTTKYSNIWFLDLNKEDNNDNNEYNKKWHKSKYKLPVYDIDNIPFIVKDNEDMVHLLSFKEDRNSHMIASLINLLPQEIEQPYASRREYLIHGYIRKLRNKELQKVQYIPQVLQHLICKYYPLFQEKDV